MTVDKQTEPPPPPVDKTKLQYKLSSHKIANGLGLLFAAIYMTVGGGGKMNTALFAGLAYLLGSGIGSAIEALQIGNKLKMVLASIVGIVIGGGFLLNNVLYKVQAEQAQLDSGNPVKYARTAAAQSTANQVLQAFPRLSAQGKRIFH